MPQYDNPPAPHPPQDRLFGGQAGSVSLYDYMRYCLQDERHGYYRSAEALGASGDFTTAPEISQVFGNCIGFWLLDWWLKAGKPHAFNIIELGPGRGVLMRDVLQIIRHQAEAWTGMQVYLLDINPHLQAMQKQVLSPFADKISWVNDFSELLRVGRVGDVPSVVIANEFFDALPVRQFVWKNEGWHERLIELTTDKQLLYALAESSDDEALALETGLREKQVPQQGDIFEYAPDSVEVMRDIARVSGELGAGLIVDYGYAGHAFGDTVQAVRQHKPTEVLVNYQSLITGESIPDLSAHVKFKLLQQCALSAGMQVSKLTTQSEFLQSMGGEIRLAKLLENCSNDKQKQALISGYQRITSPNHMGQLFKTLTLYGKSLTR